MSVTDLRAGPWRARVSRSFFALLWSLLCLLALTGCAGLSSKRTFYHYDPGYSVDSPEFRRALNALGTRVLTGNRVTLLQNGNAYFPDMLEAIASAKLSINLEMYLFKHDPVGDVFARALSRKAREGIAVRVLVDGYGARMGPLAEEMRAAGVKLSLYQPVTLFSLCRLGNRTHRKILTIDGQAAYVGGAGIDERWKGDGHHPGQWRETMLRLEGPVVTQLQAIFLEDWLQTTGEVLSGDAQFPASEAAGDVLAQAIRSARADSSSMSKLLFYMAIQAARRRIWIESAYFVPDSQIREGLVSAAKRGVDVRILVPGPDVDLPFIRQASHYFYGELLAAGVRIYEYRPAMMHNKVMVVDSIWTTIGSMNFVNRTMKMNAEANVAVYDGRVAHEVEQMMLTDQELSEQVKQRRWAHRGAFARLEELVSWLFRDSY